MDIYFDNAATTRVCPEAAQAAMKMMTENYGNPSATYTLGRNAKASVEHAREQIANALGCKAEEIYFTSCGSEGDNWAILSGARMMRRKGKHVISSQVEHDAVLAEQTPVFRPDHRPAARRDHKGRTRRDRRKARR